MELWDIKANALRLMFADTDIQFSKEEFVNESIYTNGNTRDKLVRMNDSVRRAIDLYYQYCGQYASKQKVKYALDIDGNPTNVLDISSITTFGSPTRIDIIQNRDNRLKGIENIQYYYDHIKKEIIVDVNVKNNYTFYANGVIDFKEIEFMLHFTHEKMNLPIDVNELTFDLDEIYIPSDIQRMIPKYIKGEIYEEDEYSMAQISKNEYMQFLISYSRKFGNVQTRVKSIHRRG